MKKLTFFFLLLGGMPLIWNCNQKPNADSNEKLSSNSKPCTKKSVISIADFAIQSMLQNANPKGVDEKWLKGISALREMDRKLHIQLDTSCCQPLKYMMVMSCCSCGSGCTCKPCDTTANKSFMSSKQVLGISIISASTKKTITLNSMDVGDLKMFDVPRLANDKYTLEFQTSDPNLSKVIIPILVDSPKMILEGKSGH